MAKAGGSASGQEPSEKWIQASTSFNSSSSNNSSSSSSSRNSGGGVGGTSSGASASSGSGSNSHQGQETNSGSGGGVNSDNISFECNICLDTAKDAVVSMCGHLFCWPCLHQWLETKPNRQVCPVCKAAISRDQVIPLYGRGSSRQDPRDKLPPRPPGQRSEPPDSSSSFNSANFPGFGDGGFHMSFGIGAFPFGFFTSSFNFNETRPFPNLTLENQEDMTFNRIFLWVALIFIAWLLLA